MDNTVSFTSSEHISSHPCRQARPVTGRLSTAGMPRRFSDRPSVSPVLLLGRNRAGPNEAPSSTETKTGSLWQRLAIVLQILGHRDHEQGRAALAANQHRPGQEE